MEYRLLGRTGLYVSKICLGTMTWGSGGNVSGVAFDSSIWQAIGTLPLDTAKAHLKKAVDAGVNFIDTANVYHMGQTEELLGQSVKELGLRRHELVIATKVRMPMGPGPNGSGLTRFHIMHQVEESLRRLQTDWIDLYQIHGVDAITPIDETLRALDDLVRAGKVRYLGTSNQSAWQIMKALGISQERGLARFESVQAYYSIAGRELEREIIPLAQDQNLGIMVWSPLAGGFLSGKFRKDASGPEGARRMHFDFPPVPLERAWPILDVMEAIARDHGCSVARVALAWVLHQPAVTCIIIGAKTDAQLKDNLDAVALKLTSDQLDKLNEVSALAPEYPAWMLQWLTHDRIH